MLRVTTYYVVVSIIFLFSPVFGEDSHLGSYFSDGLKPSTRLWLRYEILKVLSMDFFYNPMMVFLSCTLFVKEGSFLDDALIVEVRSTKKIGDLPS